MTILSFKLVIDHIGIILGFLTTLTGGSFLLHFQHVKGFNRLKNIVKFFAVVSFVNLSGAAILSWFILNYNFSNIIIDPVKSISDTSKNITYNDPYTIKFLLEQITEIQRTLEFWTVISGFFIVYLLILMTISMLLRD